ncbi:MAG: hypothetical protein IIV47_00875 [Clostridia bacterium]|nr:hypothetical protein [Clostridia bacterium]
MANLICAKCNQPISEENAVECPFCWEIYHKECWEDTENCVNCKKYNPIYEMAQAQKEYEALNQPNEENELKDKENTVDEDFTQFNNIETQSSPVANSVLLASLILLVSGIAGGVALAIYMYLAGKIIVGIIGGVALAGFGAALSLAVKGVAEIVNNSQKNAYYLSKLVENQKEKDE